MWKRLTITGAVGAVIYALHVIIGGALWPGYSHLMQPISDLTASGAPDRQLLLIFTSIYGVCAIIFAISGYIYLKSFAPKVSSISMLLFGIMQAASLSYGMFPEDLPGTETTFNGIMHIVVTAAIVPFTIISPLLLGIGFVRNDMLKRYGYYSILTSAVIFIFGGMSVAFAVNGMKYFGLVERINIGSLQLWMFVISIFLFGINEERMQAYRNFPDK